MKKEIILGIICIALFLITAPAIADSAVVAESPHPTAPNTEYNWTVSNTSATQMRFHFQEYGLNAGDYIQFFDSHNNLLYSYGLSYQGTSGADVWTDWYALNYYTIKLTTSGGNRYGLLIDEINTRTGDNCPPTQPGVIAESCHPTAARYEKTWTVSNTSATQMRFHFKEYGLNAGDYIQFFDSQNNLLYSYGFSYQGTSGADVWTNWNAANNYSIKLITSGGNRYGLLIDKADPPIPVPTTGSISVSSIPTGAQIFLDGSSTGQNTPNTFTGISAGQHEVVLKLAGYQDFSQTVTVTAGQTTTVTATLTPLVTTGSISVSSAPSGAQIYLDGNSTGYNTPQTLIGISAGSHMLLLKLNGYIDDFEQVTVTAGQTTIVNATLEPVSPIAVFTASPLAGTYPLSVQFTDHSTGVPPLTYLWGFGDGSNLSTEQNPVHVYPAVGKFSVILTVTSSAGNDTLTRQDYIDVYTPTPSDYNITLGEGWNMVSVPKKLAPGYDTGSIFKNVMTEGRTIWEYDGSIHNWVPLYEDTPVLPLYGFWIYSKYPTTVPIKFDPNPLQIPPTRTLVKGWELIGFTGTIPASARDTLISVRNNWTQAMGFDTTAYQYDIQIINGGSGQFSDERLMHPTKGYWLFMTGPGDLSAIGV